MSQTGPAPTGERWNVNMPAVIGVVFVFLCAVVIWVIVTSGDDDGDGAASSTTVVADSVAVTSSTASVPGTTTPAPMPSTSVVSSTAPTSEPPPTTAVPTTVAPTTAAPTTEPGPTTPPTTAAGADPDAVPGDLAIPNRPMRQPTCDGGFITVLASAIGTQATASSVEAVLDTYPGSNYLRTDQTCPSLRPARGGEPIYVVFLGPFAFETDACTARAAGPSDAYARQLSNDLGPDHSVDCG